MKYLIVDVDGDGKTSLPVRGAWIEIWQVGTPEQQRRSLPVRGAWIEIWYTIENGEIAEVAPCEGSVD